MWEDIGPNGGGPTNTIGSWDHGWSSGAAPVLTDQVLGIRPASPGFASFVAEPHPSGLAWAKGDVPTPKGALHLEWSFSSRSTSVRVDSPVPGTIVVPRHRPDAPARRKEVEAAAEATKVTVGAGSHWLLIAP